MSTILKALRRLEADRHSEEEADDGSSALDARARPSRADRSMRESGEGLRARVLAEELAAEAAGTPASDTSARGSAPLASTGFAAWLDRRGRWVAAGLVLVLAGGFLSTVLGAPEQDAVSISPEARTSVPAATSLPDQPLPRPVSPAPRPVAPPPPPSAPAPPTVALAPAAPAPPAVALAPAAPAPPAVALAPSAVALAPAPQVELRPIPAPDRVAADQPAVPPQATAEKSALAPANESAIPPAPRPPVAAQKERSAPAAVEADARSELARIEKVPIPDVEVVRTAWHPDPDRRSARIRLLESDEVVTLSEGDAAGALVIKEITPSSVLFSTGDIEIRRRVGD